MEKQSFPIILRELKIGDFGWLSFAGGLSRFATGGLIALRWRFGRYRRLKNEKGV